MLSIPSLTTMTDYLREALKERNVDLALEECQDLVARQLGFRDWARLSGELDPGDTERDLSLSISGRPLKLHRTTHRLDVNDSDLSGSRFNDTNLSGASFNQINFSGASFNDSNMTGWHVNDVNLAGALFENVNLSGVFFKNCRLAGTLFEGRPPDEIMRSNNAA